jgi:hypothetical protein
MANKKIKGAVTSDMGGIWKLSEQHLAYVAGEDWLALYQLKYPFTFTSGGVTGRAGPSLSQLQSAYNASWTSTYLGMTTNGIQRWTVPSTGNYTVDCYGAKGGNAGAQPGGFGARAKGTFALTKGDVYQILVGQPGTQTTHSQDSQPISSGGGWSGFIDSANVPLVIAGGGGGAAANGYNTAPGRGGVITTSGDSYNGSGQGSAGSGATGDTTGGPAAGFLGNATAGSGSSDPAKSFANGAIGGESARSWGGGNAYGGFGGGGGGGGLAAGGGGGYSGGAGGTWSSYQAGGGGGSYNAGNNQTMTAANNNGDGKVIITKV